MQFWKTLKLSSFFSKFLGKFFRKMQPLTNLYLDLFNLICGASHTTSLKSIRVLARYPIQSRQNCTMTFATIMFKLRVVNIFSFMLFVNSFPLLRVNSCFDFCKYKQIFEESYIDQELEKLLLSCFTQKSE